MGGFVGFATDRGEPILLAPGLHQWDSPTVNFERLVDLLTAVIPLGPYTLVTVDEGYAAVTQDNGTQKILEGGRAYMLTHRNWKFEKFITKKIQTNDVGPVTVTTGDNVPLQATVTTNWLVEDVALTARMAANTGGQMSGTMQHEFDLSKVRSDVLRQVTATLALFCSQVNYSTHGEDELARRQKKEMQKEAGSFVPDETVGQES